ncbi:acyltransferase family protein [Anaerosacchariphilus polymeriproducens]|uniref:Acyltransferase n=1 Tax=Anaerosacchariphilus polymeriproducens TaxID=1812858 RepID=A0A371AYV5_9FIRM|nr:acyltransferase [Anaerosacchariphilus polymeriproducens]RDU24778.1 acyltransferase [Anaerosacchariphilus polymeriproducens]
MGTKRNSFINVLKGIISFMVVLGHRGLPGDFGVIADAMGRFAVPIFLMISGYFIWNVDKEIVKKKSKIQMLKILKLMIWANLIYIIWGLISTELYGYNVKLWFIDIFSLVNILKFLVLNVSKAGIHLWFIGALFYCYAILYYINKKDMYKVLYCSIPILLVLNLIISEVVPSQGILLPISLTRNFLLFGLPYFALGNFIHKYQVKILNLFSNKICIIAIVSSCLLSCFERLFIARSDMYVGSIITAFSLFVLAVKNPDFGSNSIIERIGIYYSLPVYIFHMIPLNIVSIIGEYNDIVQNKLFIWIAPFLIWCVTMFGIWSFYQMKRFIIKNPSKIEGEGT